MAAATAAITVAVLGPAAARAATINVSTTSDEFGSGSGCSLREAVEASNRQLAFGGCAAGARPDEIVLPAGIHRLTLPGQDEVNAGGDLDFIQGAAVWVHGAGAPATAIELGGGFTAGGDRVIDAVAGSVTFSGVVIRGGQTSGLDGAGARVQAGASLTLADSVVAGNRAGGGGNGGGIHSQGALNLTNVLVANNTASGQGGGISVSLGGTSVGNSTLSGNSSGSGGGGLALNGGSATLGNVTVAANTAADGGGLQRQAGTLSLRDSIVATNLDSGLGGPAAPDCSGGIGSGGGNVIGSLAGCGFGQTAGDVMGLNARLATLADNGGPTATHALLAKSPAIGRAAACPAADQRGAPREDCDSGAYELVTCKRVVVNRIGTDSKDELVGTSGPDGILALGGRDVLRGLAGKDGLCGGSGRDRLFGGKGKDRISGQGGRDVCNGGGGNDHAKSCERERRIP